MAGELSPAERQQLADLYRLITTVEDSEIVEKLTADEDRCHRLLNADIVVETSCDCKCFKVFERVINHTSNSSLNWICKTIMRGKCQHVIHKVGRVMSLRLLHQAAVLGKTQTALFLLNLDGSSANSMTARVGNTPLIIAVEKDYSELVEVLMAFGADVNVLSSDGYTPLIHSIQNDNASIFYLLLSNSRCDLNKSSHSGNALDIASQECKLWMVKCLIDAGADPKESLHALLHAVSLGDNNIVEALTKAGVDVEGSEADFSPLSLAVSEGNKEICRLLLESGANPNQRADGEPFSTLLVAVRSGREDIVQLFVDHNADLDTPDEIGCTALHHALWNWHSPCFKILLKAGADPNVRSENGTTPLWAAVYQCDVDAVCSLVKLNVDLEVPSVGEDPEVDMDEYLFLQPQTPLYVAVEEESSEIIDILVEAGYDIWHENWLVAKLSAPEGDDVVMDDMLVSRLTTMCRNPPSLQHRCRMVIRKTYGTRISKVFQQLEGCIPEVLKDYVLLTELDSEKLTDWDECNSI